MDRNLPEFSETVLFTLGGFLGGREDTHGYRLEGFSDCISGDLADMLGVSSEAVRGSLATLEALELVVREDTTVNQTHWVFLHLSERGWAYYDAYAPEE